MCLYVCRQEKIISEAQQVEVEPCSGLLADDLAEKRCSEKKMQELVSNQMCCSVTICITGVFKKTY